MCSLSKPIIIWATSKKYSKLELCCLKSFQTSYNVHVCAIFQNNSILLSALQSVFFLQITSHLLKLVQVYIPIYNYTFNYTNNFETNIVPSLKSIQICVILICVLVIVILTMTRAS